MTEGATLNRAAIIIRLNNSYVKSLANIVNNLPNDAERLNIFALVMEQAIFSLMHEVHAHALNDIKGDHQDGDLEHSKYNHNGVVSPNSPGYIETPIDGKSPASRDKIEVQKVIKGYKRKWGNL